MVIELSIYQIYLQLFKFYFKYFGSIFKNYINARKVNNAYRININIAITLN